MQGFFLSARVDPLPFLTPSQTLPQGRALQQTAAYKSTLQFCCRVFICHD